MLKCMLNCGNKVEDYFTICLKCRQAGKAKTLSVANSRAQIEEIAMFLISAFPEEIGAEEEKVVEATIRIMKKLKGLDR